MNRRNRTLIVVGVAVALASLASWGVFVAVQRIPVREVTVVEKQMVVASQPVDIGVLLNETHVKLIPWPAAAMVPGGFEKISEVMNRGVVSPLLPNEVITDSKLASLESGGGLPPNIPPGMRAMAVRVNDVIGVAGFALPTTRVDVVVTVSRQEESFSRVVVNNLRVLAAGPAYESGTGRDGKPIQTNVVTLLVTPQDAERLALAQSQGSIVLALRNPMDVEPVETRGVRMAGLLAEPNPEPERRIVNNRPRMVAPTPPPPSRPYTIETIKGTERSQVIIKPPSAGGGGQP